MGKSILVDPSKLKSASGNMDTEIAQYEKNYNQLYSEVEAMKSAWQGSDNQAYVTQIEGFREAFKAMVSVMKEYSDFLKSSSTYYSQAQEETMNAARRLTN
ncbi:MULTISPECIES: WXG100 family type VII secretion target [Clostridium]|uniref:WXG100 family type VII secretion target n=1 Tax=Clostridium TaxID=1485 RepID=UPI000826305B|nr:MULTISPECIES: WXG100 family type VII secretion target [Clostridium]PJI09599.1 WXG100 family type VII secretion target [Clostridium sp. CT7]